MDAATIQGLISGLGFPIVLVLVFLWFAYQVWSKSQEQNEKREERHYQMMAKFQASLDGFSDILSKYDVKLTTIENKIDKLEEKIEG